MKKHCPLFTPHYISPHISPIFPIFPIFLACLARDRADDGHEDVDVGATEDDDRKGRVFKPNTILVLCWEQINMYFMCLACTDNKLFLNRTMLI